MNKLNQKLTATFALALTVGASTLAAPQPANAQVIELATAALGAIFNKPPQPIPNQSYAFGTGNLNSNNFNFCLLPCTPGLGSSPVRLPVPGVTGFPPPPATGIIPPQGSISQTTVTNQVGTIPPGALPRTGFPVPSGVVPGAVPPQIVQPTPPRPTVVIPPIKLPINLPI
ncbi:MAG: hypothetical protein Kow0049_12610 [Stanieria sp.]